MNSFLKQALFRRALIFTVVVLILLVLFLTAANLKAKSFQIDETIEEIYLGDSHVRYAVNDSLVINSLNLANSSESTYFSYFKLKQLLNSNPNIKSVYLGFSYHNISEYYDQYTFGQYAREIAPNYFYILPLKEQLQMLKWNLKKLPAFMVYILKAGVLSWTNKNASQGRFDNPYNNTSAKENFMDERLNFQYFSDGYLNSFSNLNLTYFDKIVALCNTENIELFILNTPLHPYYQAKIPVDFFNKYNSIISSKEISTIDLSRLELADYCYQPDGDLVSKEGALVVTKEIINVKQDLAHESKR